MDKIEAQRRKLRIRSWRRGMKEMDLLLGPFADARLDGMDAETLALYEAFLDLPDQQLYRGFLRPHERVKGDYESLYRAVESFNQSRRV